MLLLAAAAYLGLRPLLGGGPGAQAPPAPEPEPAAAEAVEARGIVVRRERALGGQGACLLPLLDEGERAARGQALALCAPEAAALEAARLRLELSERLAQTVSGGEPEPGAQLLELAAARAAGDLPGAAALARDLGGTLSGAGAQERAARLLSELAALPEAAGAETLRAPEAGLFSSAADGLEYLAPEDLEGLTPRGLEALMAAEPESAGAMKLVSGWRWYFAAALTQAEAARFSQGDRLRIELPGFEAEARVESLGEPEGGRRVVVLSSGEALAQALGLRVCEARLWPEP